METKNILETFIANSSNYDVLSQDLLGFPLLVVKDDSKSIESLEKFRPKPLQTKEEKRFYDLRGFIDYVNDFKDEHTVCFAGANEIRVIFDYHTKDQPSWCNHQAIFKIEKSERWKIWEKAHNNWMQQKQFADFLDTGLNEIINPSQAEILNLVKNFRATTSYEFDSEASPCGGESLNFRKTSKAGSSLKEQVILPEYISLALQPFENINVLNSRLPENKQIPAYQLTGKINWQANFVDNGIAGLHFKVQILNVENVINQTLETIKTAVDYLTNIKVYIA